jgi:hypothetical protein
MAVRGSEEDPVFIRKRVRLVVVPVQEFTVVLLKQ